MTVQDDEYLAGQAVEAGAYEEAVRLLLPLAERHSEYALLTLGWIYETGATGPSNRDVARSYYEGAAAQGSASAYHYLGWLLQEGGEEVQARAAFERGAQLDNDDCKSALARLNDSDVEKLADKAFEAENYQEAARLLRPLAERNVEYALLALGWICETGAMGSSDGDAARSYYQRAADEGSAEGHYYLGRLHLVRGEDAQGRAMFEVSAERGFIPSMSRLGRMMLVGRGGPADIAAGTGWLERAAAEGNIWAQRTLLGIEKRNAKSVIERLSIMMRFLSLLMRVARLAWSNPKSDKLR